MSSKLLNSKLYINSKALTKTLKNKRFIHDNGSPYIDSKEDIASIEKWWSSPRYMDLKRDHTSLDIVKHRGNLSLQNYTKYPSSFQADKLFNLVNSHFNEKKPLHTLGVIDPLQMSQLAKCKEIKVSYISGWACSSTLVGSTNEVSPDFGDYPYDTVPNQVERIFKAQQLHDRKYMLSNFNSSGSKKEEVDYLKPIIADADMGHGGLTSVMKMAKLFAEKGAAGIHLEDQLMGGKKCGHLGGSVVVPTATHLSRLKATRFQWDLMGTNNLIIARTDSLNSRLLSSCVDPRDHAFIKGIINKNEKPLSDTIIDTQSAIDISKDDFAAIEENWYDKNKLYTYDEAVELQLSNEEFNQYKSLKAKLTNTKMDKNYFSIYEMREITRQVAPNKTVHFDWDAPKTIEGHYMFNGCTEAAIQRSIAFAPYADLIWLETKTPDLNEATNFARKIHSVYPNTKLVYNLSPSFNWMENGFTPDTLKSFIWDLAKEGFVLQLVSLAGLHVDGVSFWELAKDFQYNGMKSYVDIVQRKEKEINCDILTHQKWSGAEYIDSIMNVVNNGSSSKTQSTTGSSYTESQF
ncbi:hypothetical protein TBLA_0C00500 [Henningerozyma blattae CBS 6284]|uniref:Isocitrate lyase n=1 Tax=Henningerozyma blattae (strain ATCC 34711 / CBS 6284 / DSM 70876 / NBRC 10599 / NRRL Y-10934 / UCD 77-7) TaxID=1071380 RepID=I2H0G4_HENB6|nr:hypothetical protein TBLA_0C00500 [Tetrapisispora blattae CBS 6284]CCH59866.1 hypothetical protein TBLA_0C00500 [Tetrapisispora blattae CBS 6284]